MKLALIPSLLGLLLFFGACSDDTATADSGPDGQVVLDSAPAETAPDAGSDAARDLGPMDAPPDGTPVGPEAGADAGHETSPIDTGPDAPAGDMGTPSLSGTISRTATPLLDAKGNIIVGLYSPMIPFPTATLMLSNADLSQPGATVTYKFFNAPAGTFNLFAFLDDNNNAMAILPAADAVDLVMSTPIQVTITSTAGVVQDLVLDKVQGATDGGMGNVGALKGKVTTTATPAGDGKGTLYVSLHTQVPPAGQVVIVPQNSVDLSSPFSSALYYLGNIQPGNYYVDAFLDDNGNANFLFPGSDKGDLIISTPVQVHIVAGIINVHDIVLDVVKP